MSDKRNKAFCQTSGVFKIIRSMMINQRKWGLGSKADAIVLIVGGLYLVYWLIFLANPFFEGDDANILSGVIQLSRGVYQPLPYLYHNQPLFYWILEFCMKLSRLPLTYVAVGLSMISLLIVFISIYLIGRRMASVRFASYLVVGCLLIHELIISGAYPNSSILAMALLYLAIYIMIRLDYSLVSILIASIMGVLALYVRNDAVFMFPCFLLLLIFKRKYFPIIMAAIIMIFSGWIMMHLLRVDFMIAFHGAKEHFIRHAKPFVGTIKTLLSAMSISIIILVSLGFVSYLLKQRWRALLLIVVGILPTFLFYLPSLASAKYLLYIYPIFAWLAVQGWFLLKNLTPSFMSFLTRGIIICLLIAQFIFDTAIPPWLNIFSSQARRWHRTHDGNRPLTGILFFPLEMKLNNNEEDIRRLLLSIGVGCNRVYWVTWRERGSLKYIFGIKSKQIIRDFAGGIRQQIFILPDGSRVIVCKDGLYKKIRLDQVETFRKNGYTNIFRVHSPESSFYARFPNASFYEINNSHTIFSIPALE